MFEKWNKELCEKVKADERTKGDILERVRRETFDNLSHNMLIAEVDARGVYDLALERADLEDYLKTERKYGRTNKTR